ncbi:helix-turn-helix domain-containing protein [Limosilactobacillus mucosae]
MPKLSIGEISTALGYQEASHFSRQFCGQTPMQYRQTAKKHSQEQAK